MSKNQNQQQEFEDKELPCAEGKACKCGGTFIFTAGEQEFYASKGHSDPKRCKAGREANKKRRDEKGNHNNRNRR